MKALVDPGLASRDGEGVRRRAVIDGLPGGTWLVVDSELRLVRADGRWRGHDGIGAESARGRYLDDLLAPELLGWLRPHVQAVVAGEEQTLQLRDPKGGRRRELTLMPTHGADGRADGAVLFVCNREVSSAYAAAESERRYRLLAESATDVVSLRDRDGIYRYVSPSATALCGYQPEELVGRRASTFVDPEDRGAVESVFARLLAGEDVVDLEYRVICQDGARIWVQTTARALRDSGSGEVVEVRTSTHDVTEQREREAKLEATTAELKLRLHATAAIAQLGEHALEEPDLDCFLTAAAVSVAEILGVPLCAVSLDDGNERGGLRISAGVGWRPGTTGSFIASLAVAASWPPPLGHASAVFTELPPDPAWQSLLADHGAVSSMWVVIGERGGQSGVLSVHAQVHRTFTNDDRTFLVAVANIVRDVIARHRAEDAGRHDALHDALTGLPNRRLLTDRLGHALERTARTGERHAVLFLDVDQFKLVNDSLGHDAGDRLLRLLAPALCAAVRPEDTVARFGGDEFVVLCEDVRDEQHAVALARRLTDAVNQSFDLDGREHVARASIGVAVTNGNGCTSEDVLREADTAMYRAKERGRSRFELFDGSMRRHTVARLQLEDELRSALAHDELIVHYQPIHAIHVEVPAMLEALVRWQHPERGLLSPAEFIPVAEETNLIVPLGAEVLRQACAQVALWREALPGAHELTLSVNVSSRQITRPTFDLEVAQTLSQTGLPAHALCLEITEGVLLQDSSTSAETIAKLRARGIRIALDDFGTGYSSLSYLRCFSLDLLKIDRSFIAGLDSHAEDWVIVKAIIMIAHAFGLDVTAEGVETAEQLEAVHDLGCANAQGYLLARPMPAADIEDLLGKHAAQCM